MMVMTTRVNFKKTILILAAAAVLLTAAIAFLGGKETGSPVSAPTAATNEGRVNFLRELGWDVEEAAKESSQVKIPTEMSEVYRRYNALQTAQGYDLTRFAGKNVLRYVYSVKNYPGSGEPVYATLLVFRDRIIGGDITDTAADGKIRGLQKAPAPEAPPAVSVPTVSAPAVPEAAEPSAAADS